MIRDVEQLSHVVLVHGDLARVKVSQDCIKGLQTAAKVNLQLLLQGLVHLKLLVEPRAARGQHASVGREPPALDEDEKVAEAALFALDPQFVEHPGKVLDLGEVARFR